MIIILEGADGTGKTTLANKLCEKLSAKYIHATWSRELDCRMLEYQMNILSEAYEHYIDTSLPTVIDRLWLSESVYGTCFRNGSKFPYQGRIIEKFIDSIGGFTICCLSMDLEAHKKRFLELKDNRFEMYTSVETVVQLYNDFFYGTNKQIIRSSSYMQDIIQAGGASTIGKHKKYFKYEIEVEGKNIDNYVSNMKEELQARQTIRRY